MPYPLESRLPATPTLSSSQNQPPTLFASSVSWKAEPCRLRAPHSRGTGFQSSLANGVRLRKAGGWQDGGVGVLVPVLPLLLHLILRVVVVLQACTSYRVAPPPWLQLSQTLWSISHSSHCSLISRLVTASCC